MRKLSFPSILFILIAISNAYSEINEAQKKIIRSQVILIHEGMVSQETVFKKAKLFDKEGILGIGKSEMSQEEFKSFLDKESLHFGY